jgi:hypothetical protein
MNRKAVRVLRDRKSKFPAAAKCSHQGDPAGLEVGDRKRDRNRGDQSRGDGKLFAQLCELFAILNPIVA